MALSQHSQQLVRLLRTPSADEPPRRAVVTAGGALCDRTDAPPGCPEIASMSAVCEVVRRMAGLPVYPRDSGELMQQCLERNEHGAWQAMYNDVRTGDVDWDRLAAVIGPGSGSAHACVGCLLAPRDATHLLNTAACLAAMLDHVTPEAKHEFASLLGLKLTAFSEVLIRHNAVMRRDVREGVLTVLGRLLAKADVPLSHVADVLQLVLARKHDDLLRLFMHLPVAACVAPRPDLLAQLVARARATSPTTSSRYPVLAVLARVVAAAAATDDSCAARHGPDLADLVKTTLAAQLSSSGGIDPRTALVCAMLAQAAGPEAAAPLAPFLAKALERTASSLVLKV